MPLFRRSEQVKDLYAIIRLVGEGQFAEVYEVERIGDGMRFALKVDKERNVRTVRREGKILQNLSRLQQFCQLHDVGSVEGRSFVVMDLMGPNLVQTRKQHYSSGKMPVLVVKAVAFSTLCAIEALHSEGYIHRDIKPANFVLSHQTDAIAEGCWHLIDFGLARRFCDDSDIPLPERQDAGFRGSTTYASVHAHEDRDLSRRDDIWSWLYMIVELIEGDLPWRCHRDAVAGAKTDVSEEHVRALIGQQKRLFARDPGAGFASDVWPGSLKDIVRYIDQLEFEEKPDYSFLRKKLEEFLEDRMRTDALASKHLRNDVISPRKDESRLSDRKDRVEPSSSNKDRIRQTSESQKPLAQRWKRFRESDRFEDHSELEESNSRARILAESPESIICSANETAMQNYKNVMEFVTMLRAGGLSRQGTTAVDCMRKLKPLESIGVCCMLLDDLAGELKDRQAADFAPILDELAGFACIAAEQCRSRI